MLVLMRKTNESIVIDGRITITILKVKGNRIQIGIEAPSSIKVKRSELVSSKNTVVTAA
jgi:carbon storage regulator